MPLFRKKRTLRTSYTYQKKLTSSGWWQWVEQNRAKLLKILLVAAGVGVLTIVGIFAYVARDLPSSSNLDKRHIAESTKIYDRTGEHILYEVHGEENRTVIPLDQIPESVQKATIALEDQSFYSHYGIQPKAIIRAALKDFITFDAQQGASTITQQFVKNSLLTSDRTLSRKIKEAILAIEVEIAYSKDEILGMYLNEIPYGQNAYGIEAAAQTFFGKSAKDLSLDEAALLASLPRGTAYYSPYGSHADKLVARKNYALDQMARLGYITEDQATEAKNTDTLAKVQPPKDVIDAPHFVMYVREYLQEKYGDQALEQGGYKVYTTLDWNLQQAAEKAVKEGAAKNVSWRASNAALVAIDPKTGQILAMVGSKDYFDKDIDGNVNVAVSERQPGSSFKPYVYLTAFQKGYFPDTILYDVPTEFNTDTANTYAPTNYNNKYNGPVTMAKALGGSLNIPAVKTLYLAGVKDSIEMATNLGITSINDPSRVGLSLVLGGGEVTLLDHVSAYSTLANDGVRQDKTSILKIEDNNGKVLEEYQPSSGKRVVEEKYIAMLDSILSNDENRAWIFGANSPLAFTSRQVVAKTGTTNEFRDGWTLGYTPSIAAGVWVGNNDNTPMRPGADGSVVAAPIWRAFMNAALANSSTESFPTYDYSEDLKKVEDRPLLGGKIDTVEDLKVCDKGHDEYCLRSDACPTDTEKKRTFISPHDILHYVNRDDPQGDQPSDPKNDPQYENWEKGVEKYYKDKDSSKTIIQEPPTNKCDSGDF